VEGDSHQPIVADVGTSIRLLTFNTLFLGRPRPRLRALSQALDGMELDVVCLQEVLWRRHLSSIATGFPHAAYVPRGPAVKGGLLTLSRWPMEEPRYLEYRVRSGRRPDLFDRLLRRGLLITRISISGRPVTVVNTHLLANPTGDWSRSNPYARAGEVALNQLAEAVSADHRDPMVVMGDFNVPRGSWLLDEFLARAGLRDVLAGDRRPTYRPTPKIPIPAAIDHVLVRPTPSQEMRVEAELVFQERMSLPGGRAVHLSDHFGIEASIQLSDQDAGRPSSWS
jgi:endonuclease/exonuclease/phosphatase family metal-dependent hydrolase